MAAAVFAWAGLGQQAAQPTKPEQQTVNCTATAPASGYVGAALQFQATAALSGLVAGNIVEIDALVGTLRFVPAGTFTQGSPSTETCIGTDERQFRHTLTKNLAVMETAVTRKMWADLRALQGSLPADFQTFPETGEPVNLVSWYLSVLYANLLSIQRGLIPVYRIGSAVGSVLDASNYQTNNVYADWGASGYRLPTEGEREYFTRAGTTVPFSIDEPSYTSANCRSCSAGILPALESVSWFCANSDRKVHPAGTKAANPWGLKDLHGNVYEWCWDWYYMNPQSDQTDYTGPSVSITGTRVLRGGNYNGTPALARSASRHNSMPSSTLSPYGSYGIRLVKVWLPPASSAAEATLPEQNASWDWDFGDGTAHSILQNPQHAYARAGTFNWSMRATINGISCGKSGTAVIAEPVTVGQLSGVLDSPDGKNPVSGIANVFGWAVVVSGNQAGKTMRVNLLVDGAYQKALTTGIDRPDVRNYLAGTGIMAPSDLGYSGTWDSRSVADGNHTLTIRAADAAGIVLETISDIAAVTVRTSNGILPTTTTTLTTTTTKPPATTTTTTTIINVTTTTAGAPSSTTTTRPTTSTTTSTSTSTTTSSPTTSSSTSTTTTLANFYQRLFPKVFLNDPTHATGLAILNLSPSPASLQFKAYSNSGSLIGTAQRILQPNAQFASVVSELLINLTGGTGWLSMESTVPNVEGLFLLYDNALATMDGSAVAGSVYREFVLPVAEGAEVSLVNPGIAPVDCRLSYVSNAGTQLNAIQGTIPALSRIAIQADTIRPQGAWGGYLRGSCGGVVPLEVFGNAYWTAVLDATDASPTAAVTTQFAPQFVAGSGYISTLDLINLEASPTTLTLTWFDDAGGILGQPATVALPTIGAAHLSGPLTFGVSKLELIQGYVKIQSNGGRFAGAVRFTDPQQLAFGTALNLVSTGQTESYFSQVAQDTQYFTGLAAINPGTRVAAVTLTVYDTAGRQVATGATQIPAGGRFSKLLPELVGTVPAMSKGYFQVRSTEPLLAFALFGTWNGSVLSAIPAQVATGR